MKIFLVCLGLASAALMSGCGTNYTEETGQTVADVSASIDEASGSNGGTFAQLQRDQISADRMFARLEPHRFWEIAEAQAATCSATSTFSSCTSNVITRTFGDCTVGSTTFSGSVTLTWGGGAASCSMTSSGHKVTRVPAFTVTGRRGATLTVSKTGTNGQVLTRNATAGSFAFSNDGIRRAFTTASGTTLFDFTAATTSDITVTGASRAGRVVSGGTLRITNNSTSVTCDYSPTNVTWVSTCNCPTSGSWSGTCSNGNTSTVTFSGCGTGSVALGSSTESSVTFDRCYAI